MIEIPAIIIVIIIVWFIAHKRGFKSGKKEADLDTYRYGYKKGTEVIEKEIFDLAKEKNEEILRRVQNFARNYKGED